MGEGQQVRVKTLISDIETFIEIGYYEAAQNAAKELAEVVGLMGRVEKYRAEVVE